MNGSHLVKTVLKIQRKDWKTFYSFICSGLDAHHVNSLRSNRKHSLEQVRFVVILAYDGSDFNHKEDVCFRINVRLRSSEYVEHKNFAVLRSLTSSENIDNTNLGFIIVFAALMYRTKISLEISEKDAMVFCLPQCILCSYRSSTWPMFLQPLEHKPAHSA